MTEDDVRDAICGFLGKPSSAAADDVGLMELVTDSFTLVELVIFLEQRTGLHATAEELRDVVTVGDLLELLGRNSP